MVCFCTLQGHRSDDTPESHATQYEDSKDAASFTINPKLLKVLHSMLKVLEEETLISSNNNSTFQ